MEVKVDGVRAIASDGRLRKTLLNKILGKHVWAYRPSPSTRQSRASKCFCGVFLPAKALSEYA